MKCLTDLLGKSKLLRKHYPDPSHRQFSTCLDLDVIQRAGKAQPCFVASFLEDENDGSTEEVIANVAGMVYAGTWILD